MAQRRGSQLIALHEQAVKIVNKWVPSSHPKAKEADVRSILQRGLNKQWSRSRWNERDAASFVDALKKIDSDVCRKSYPLSTKHLLVPADVATSILHEEQNTMIKRLPFHYRTIKKFLTGK